MNSEKNTCVKIDKTIINGFEWEFEYQLKQTPCVPYINKNKFHGYCDSLGETDYYNSLDEAVSNAHKITDEFIEDVPQSDAAWVSAIASCMVWTGYEDCHIDDKKCLLILAKARKHFYRK